MTTTIPEQLAIVRRRVAELREHVQSDDAGELASVCSADGYPTTMTCVCGHGHTRHVGQPGSVRCMSYVGHPDCGCLGFVPMPRDVAALWREHLHLVRALDVSDLIALLPDPAGSSHVEDWPADEQAVWRVRSDRQQAMAAIMLLRRQKTALRLLTHLLGETPGVGQ